ncbi:A/G-specific adenine glycosylase [Desulfatiferula olefinivorans]
MQFSRCLLKWYQTEKRPMPWRNSRDPYHIWLSEVMLQQTQVATVIPYYHRFLERFPDLTSLASAADEAVLKLWEGLGYYRRCHHFLAAVRTVCGEHGGRIPSDPDTFSRLPGVGDYTTAAVMSIAFGLPLPVVDGNVIRVITRHDRIDADSTKTATRKAIRNRMADLMDPESPGDFNQAIMELGAMVCTPKQPRCEACPVAMTCGARVSGTVMRYPVIPLKNKIPEYRVGLGVLVRDGRFLIQKRKDEGHLAGMWEFPGGKALDGETVEEALQRKCLEELGVHVTVGRRIAQASHVYSHFRIRVSLFLIDEYTRDIRPLKNQPLRWIEARDLADIPLPKVNHKLFSALHDIDAFLT